MNQNLKHFIFAALMALSLVVNANISHAAENTLKIESTNTLEILAAIKGKKLVTNKGYIMLQLDGQITGMMDGALVSGKWAAEGDFYCRSIKYGDKRVDTDCQIILNTPDGVVFHRHRGAGRKVGPYLVQIM